MDMDRSQTGDKVGSLLTVIEAADPDIIGNRIPQLIQCLDQIHVNKVIGADKGIRLRHPENGVSRGCPVSVLTLLMAAVYGIMGYVIVFVFTPAFLLGMGFCAMLCSFLMLRILYLIGGDPDAVYEEHDHDKN